MADRAECVCDTHEDVIVPTSSKPLLYLIRCQNLRGIWLLQKVMAALPQSGPGLRHHIIFYTLNNVSLLFSNAIFEDYYTCHVSFAKV